MPIPGTAGRAADSKVVKTKGHYSLYIGDKGTKATLTFVENVIKMFNTGEFVFMIGPNKKHISVHLEDTGAPLMAYVVGLGSIYELKLEVHGGI